MRYLIAYGASAVVFFGLDLLWLGLLARGFYLRQMVDLLRDPPNLGIAGLFYLVYVGGIVLFAVLPALQAQSWRSALLLGLALGVVATAPTTSPTSPRSAAGRRRSLRSTSPGAAC